MLTIYKSSVGVLACFASLMSGAVDAHGSGRN